MTRKFTCMGLLAFYKCETDDEVLIRIYRQTEREKVGFVRDEHWNLKDVKDRFPEFADDIVPDDLIV